MFTSALPVRAWRGGVSAGGPPSVSATQRLTDAGAPPPSASGGQKVWPTKSSKAGALGTSEAEARRTMLQACGRRAAVTEEKRFSVEQVTDTKGVLTPKWKKEERKGGMSSDLCLPDAQTKSLEEANQKGGMSDDLCLPEALTNGGSSPYERFTPTGLKQLSRKRWQKLSRARRTEVKRKPKRADLPVKCTENVDRVDTMALDTMAVKELVDGVYTVTARKSAQARVDWWTARAVKRGLQPFPLDAAKLTLAGALLKKGAYRSASQYLYTLKKQHVSTGGAWGPELCSLFKDVKRSCARGRGGPRQADALPLGNGVGQRPYVGSILVNAEASLVVGIWWMLREIELANLEKGDILFTKGTGCGVATLRVSASKTDWQAKGVSRHHGCACPSYWCPVRAAKALWTSTGDDAHSPLVQTLQDRTPTKAMVCQEIKLWAKHLGAQDGSYTGHSLRTTGAQRLAAAGVSEEKIRLFGRWTSTAMLKYVRDTLLADSGIVVAQIVEGRLGSSACSWSTAR